MSKILAILTVVAAGTFFIGAGVYTFYPTKPAPQHVTVIKQAAVNPSQTAAKTIKGLPINPNPGTPPDGLPNMVNVAIKLAPPKKIWVYRTGVGLVQVTATPSGQEAPAGFTGAERQPPFDGYVVKCTYYGTGIWRGVSDDGLLLVLVQGSQYGWGCQFETYFCAKAWGIPYGLVYDNSLWHPNAPGTKYPPPNGLGGFIVGGQPDSVYTISIYP